MTEPHSPVASIRRVGSALVIAVVLAGLPTMGGAAASGALSMTGFSPISGPVGTVVTITGTGFVNADVVTFSGAPASGANANKAGTRLKASVPAFATSGPIMVTDPVSGQTVGLPGTTFRVTTGLAASPAGVWPGQAFTLSGSALSPDVSEVIMLKGQAIGQARTDGFGNFQARLVTPITLQPRKALIAVPDPNLGVVSIILNILASWPQVSYNPARTANNPYETVLSTKTVAKMVPHWSGALVSDVYSPPIVAGGMVFIYAGSELEAIDASAGSLVWSHTFTDLRFQNAPAVANGIVYATDNGFVYAFNASNGSVVWAASIGSRAYAPLVANGALIVGTSSGNVERLDASDGLVIWSTNVGVTAWSPPTLAGGVVYVGTSDGTVFALNATNGHILWSFVTGGPVTGPLAVSGGTIFVPSQDQHIYAVSTSTHSAIWSFGAGNTDDNGVAVNGSTVFVSNSGFAGAFSASTGAKIWDYTLHCGWYGPPAYANGILYVSCDQVELALDAALGFPRWSYTLPGSDFFDTRDSPAVSNGVLYVGGSAFNGVTGGLYTFGL